MPVSVKLAVAVVTAASSAPATVPTVVHGPVEAVALWMVKPVGTAVVGVAAAATVRLIVPLEVPGAAVTVGAVGATARIMARIMSFSSCPRMWQCQTYSQPKLIFALLTAAGLLSGSMFVNSTVDWKPTGCVTFIGLELFGTANGRVCLKGRSAMMTSSSGFIRTV